MTRQLSVSDPHGRQRGNSQHLKTGSAVHLQEYKLWAATEHYILRFLESVFLLFAVTSSAILSSWARKGARKGVGGAGPPRQGGWQVVRPLELVDDRAGHAVRGGPGARLRATPWRGT